jgi:CRISPR-associated exonuclease Cas4
MIDRADVGMLPISSLNAIEYCPRKFYYQFVQGEMLVNDLVLEGTLAHERVHQAGSRKTGMEEFETTRLYLYSEELHVSGFADVIEERKGLLVPVEYKHGQVGEWINDHVQLCAQAMCLEERLTERQPNKERQLASSSSIPYGYIFYIGSRRRVKVQFTEQLRARTRETISLALKVATLRTSPPPLSGKMVERCPDCAMLPLCMPDEVRMLQSRKRK